MPDPKRQQNSAFFAKNCIPAHKKAPAPGGAEAFFRNGSMLSGDSGQLQFFAVMLKLLRVWKVVTMTLTLFTMELPAENTRAM